MKSKSYTLHLLIFLLNFTFFACTTEDRQSPQNKQVADKAADEMAFVATLQQHLNAVTEKDLEALASTMSPEGKMQLILPGSEIMDSVDQFIDYHRAWFQDTTWTFETKILNTDVGDRLGLAITEIIYREPERDGKPYWNRMVVSYGLEKIDGHWYIIKDHASSIEKSTD